MRVNSILSKKEGFTLIEILIVISIILILVSISLPFYQNYRQKAVISSIALPIVNSCANDIVIYCVERSVNTPTVIDVNSVNLTNCQDTTILEYNLDLNISGNFTCYPGGNIGSGSIEAIISEIPTYKAVCDLNENSINCRVEER